MSWTKLAIEALSRVLPPAAEWLASRFQNGNSSNSSAEANRHGTQSGAARNASGKATEKMAHCEHEWQPSASVSPSGAWRCSKCPAVVGGFPGEFAEQASRALGDSEGPPRK